jgi:hypothetical protein
MIEHAVSGAHSGYAGKPGSTISFSSRYGGTCACWKRAIDWPKAARLLPDKRF